MKQPPTFTWKFQRLGGLDQLTLRTAQELCRLRDLDPKLWAVLSCPASGLEFDKRTLALVDSNNDDRIHIHDVVAAVEWLCARLKEPEAIASPQDVMPLEAVNAETAEGSRLLASARAILGNLGKADAGTLSQQDVSEAAAGAAENLYNGDGIVPPAKSIEPELRRFVSEALGVMGGVTDAGGEPGINKEIAAAFIESLRRWQNWKKFTLDTAPPFGENSTEAWELFKTLKDKIDDYFLRCELAAFAPQISDILNRPETTNERLAASFEAEQNNGLLDLSTLADLPIARVNADRPLCPSCGLNPVWRDRFIRFLALVRPALTSPDALDRNDWQEVGKRFVPYSEAFADMPDLAPVRVDLPPSSDIAGLGDGRVAEILDSDLGERFDRIADMDAAVPAAAADIAEVERLVLYYLHLHRLLMNFVSLYEFYSLERKALFQAGALYMDGRCCHLCLPVEDVERHARLASFSNLCLLYCQCVRKENKEPKEDSQMRMVAAMTAGRSDTLMDGRNGVYVDSSGDYWDATIIKIVDNPISLRQSLWEPYRRFGRMVSEQIGKIASFKKDNLADSVYKKMQEAQKETAAATPGTPPPAFDIGKSVGIFAAIGLALGALATAVASIAKALFALSWWQFPLVLAGLFLIISGPYFVIAWLKIRKRTLGPVLDASGWAVNSMVPINFALGNALTTTAHLPDNAVRNSRDPLRHIRRWPRAVLAFAAVGLSGGAVWLWWWLQAANKL